MDFVDNIDLIFAFRRGIGYLLTDFTDIVHPVVGSSVNFDHVHGTACGNSPAGLADPAGAPFHWALAVDCLCKNFCNGGLSGPPGPAEQVGMPDPFRLNLVF